MVIIWPKNTNRIDLVSILQYLIEDGNKETAAFQVNAGLYGSDCIFVSLLFKTCNFALNLCKFLGRSMWISNTATTAMVAPIALAIIQEIIANSSMEQPKVPSTIEDGSAEHIELSALLLIKIGDRASPGYEENFESAERSPVRYAATQYTWFGHYAYSILTQSSFLTLQLSKYKFDLFPTFFQCKSCGIGKRNSEDNQGR